MTILNIDKMLTHADLGDRIDRLMLADALEDVGRTEEAELLRACGRYVLVDHRPGDWRVVSVYDFVYAGYREAASKFGHAYARTVRLGGNAAEEAAALMVVRNAEEADAYGLSAVNHCERGEWSYACADARRAIQAERTWRPHYRLNGGSILDRSWLWFHDVVLRDAKMFARRVED